MSAATWILTVVPFEGCSKVGMTGTRHGCEQAVIGRMSICVLEYYSKWGSGGMAFIDAADYLRLVSFCTWSRTFGSAFSSENILIEILHRQFKPGRDTVKGYTYEFSV